MDAKDWIEEAECFLHHSDNNPDPLCRLMALQAIAAALIAQAEAMQRKPQFVQVGEMAYNLDQIQIVNLEGGTVGLWLVGDDPDTVLPSVLKGPDAAAFLAWWNEHADVVRLDAGPDRNAVEEAQ
jgi:hypothetical protein